LHLSNALKKKSLLQAVADFKERIAPIFKEHKAQSDQLQELQIALESVEDQNEQIQELLARSRSLEDQVLGTRRAQQQVETERDRAVELAEKAVKELNMTRSDNASLGERVSELGQEISKLKGILQAHKFAVGSYITIYRSINIARVHRRARARLKERTWSNVWQS
jgi:chromosome segregation ATPase